MPWFRSSRTAELVTVGSALVLWSVVACGQDELLRGDDVIGDHAGGSAQQSGGNGGTIAPDASSGGSDAALHGSGGVGGALDASSDGVAGSAGQLADASDATVVAPDFGLEDVNPASSLYQTTVSPRDFLGKVSAWYFGHST